MIKKFWKEYCDWREASRSWLKEHLLINIIVYIITFVIIIGGYLAHEQIRYARYWRK